MEVDRKVPQTGSLPSHTFRSSEGTSFGMRAISSLPSPLKITYSWRRPQKRLYGPSNHNNGISYPLLNKKRRQDLWCARDMKATGTHKHRDTHNNILKYARRGNVYPCSSLRLVRSHTHTTPHITLTQSPLALGLTIAQRNAKPGFRTSFFGGLQVVPGLFPAFAGPLAEMNMCPVLDSL